MRRTSRRIQLCMALLVVNLLFIWGNSALPAQASNAISHWVEEVLSVFFPGEVGTAGAGHGLLRKAAHFSEFACLGMLLAWLFGMLGQKGRGLWAVSLLSGIAAACVDETIQVFSPGRSSSLLDVWIDTSGVLAGVGLLLLGYTIYQKKCS